MSKIKKNVRVCVLWKFRPDGMSEEEQLMKFNNEKPRLRVIFEHTNRADPNAMLVMNGKEKVGYINADDTKWLAPAMMRSRSGVNIDFARVVKARGEGSAVLKYQIEVERDEVKELETKTDWTQFVYTFPELDMPSELDFLDYLFNSLLMQIGGAEGETMSPRECVEEICKLIRYDLCKETSNRINECCYALEMAGMDELADMLEQASTCRRSRHGLEVWNEWFEALLDSARADFLLALYKNECKRKRGVTKVTRKMMAEDWKRLEMQLLTLPDKLHLFLDEPSKLMHMAYYKGMTSDMQIKVLSALVLRQILKPADLKMLEEEGDDMGKEDATELFHFIHPAIIDDDQQLRIHKQTTNLVRSFGVQEICLYLTQMKNEKLILLPQSVQVAYDELCRIGMRSDDKGYDYKNFAKYYTK